MHNSAHDATIVHSMTCSYDGSAPWNGERGDGSDRTAMPTLSQAPLASRMSASPAPHRRAGRRP